MYALRPCAFLLLICCLASCSIFSPKPTVGAKGTEKKVKRYRGGSGPARFYRELRRRDWGNYTKGRRKPDRPPRPRRFRRSTEVDKRALGREIGQNKDYFCIVNRRDRRFPTQDSCRRFVEEKDGECIRLHGWGLSRRRLSCLKRRLK